MRLQISYRLLVDDGLHLDRGKLMQRLPSKSFIARFNAFYAVNLGKEVYK